MLYRLYQENVQMKPSKQLTAIYREVYLFHLATVNTLQHVSGLHVMSVLVWKWAHWSSEVCISTRPYTFSLVHHLHSGSREVGEQQRLACYTPAIRTYIYQYSHCGFKLLKRMTSDCLWINAWYSSCMITTLDRHAWSRMHTLVEAQSCVSDEHVAKVEECSAGCFEPESLCQLQNTCKTHLVFCS